MPAERGSLVLIAVFGVRVFVLDLREPCRLLDWSSEEEEESSLRSDSEDVESFLDLDLVRLPTDSSDNSIAALFLLENLEAFVFFGDTPE